MSRRYAWQKSWVSSGLARLFTTRTRRSCCSGRPGADHQPPPPPPPPPPPDEPPPPDPLDDPGAVEAELTLLASEEPTSLTKPSASFHGLWLPEYQAKPL